VCCRFQGWPCATVATVQRATDGRSNRAGYKQWPLVYLAANKNQVTACVCMTLSSDVFLSTFMLFPLSSLRLQRLSHKRFIGISLNSFWGPKAKVNPSDHKIIQLRYTECKNRSNYGSHEELWQDNKGMGLMRSQATNTKQKGNKEISDHRRYAKLKTNVKKNSPRKIIPNSNSHKEAQTYHKKTKNQPQKTATKR